MHHAYFCRYRQGTVASFLNPDLTNKPWDVHFYCVLMACGVGSSDAVLWKIRKIGMLDHKMLWFEGKNWSKK